MKVGVVTGCAGGVGAATVELLRSRDWYVVGIDRAAEGDGPGCDERFRVDLADLSAVREAMAAVRSRHPRVHGLVNNAAEQLVCPLEGLTDADFLHVLRVNLVAAHALTQELQQALDAAAGAVVNVASVHAVCSTPQMAAYASSKAALLAYTRVAALEMAPRVRVNAVLPGAVDTAMLHAGFSRRPGEGSTEESVAALAARTPLGVVAPPHQIATVIGFLLDDGQSGYVTGQGIVVDGGATVRLPSE